ncbi:hypothetical protein EOB59_29980 [Mesorhizobium sp. M7A.F.Ca.MR.176.00.0.0]|uniref:hypothetical protein n=1 Tax=Mesorhizobium sp. M7A.F.Ca.MR.176.00.0.0 TaxID=2496776 RepID=UPI000FD40E0D|nr:hypothetical protein [Mesorhizobium sp. M7A.F.Ca.MR.176.00.0.0]RUU86113.1 hypothetical protein EOB59_29980 [Mesorhizobium sp. M7A.F.Ca.MR.176.00.0.0]
MTDLNPDVAVQTVAEYLVTPVGQRIRATVPEMRERFGLTTIQVIEAIRLANALRLERAG